MGIGVHSQFFVCNVVVCISTLKYMGRAWVRGYVCVCVCVHAYLWVHTDLAGHTIVALVMC